MMVSLRNGALAASTATLDRAAAMPA